MSKGSPALGHPWPLMTDAHSGELLKVGGGSCSMLAFLHALGLLPSFDGGELSPDLVDGDLDPFSPQRALLPVRDRDDLEEVGEPGGGAGAARMVVARREERAASVEAYGSGGCVLRMLH